MTESSFVSVRSISWPISSSILKHICQRLRLRGPQGSSTYHMYCLQCSARDGMSRQRHTLEAKNGLSDWHVFIVTRPENPPTRCCLCYASINLWWHDDAIIILLCACYSSNWWLETASLDIQVWSNEKQLTWPARQARHWSCGSCHAAHAHCLRSCPDPRPGGSGSTARGSTTVYVNVRITENKIYNKKYITNTKYCVCDINMVMVTLTTTYRHNEMEQTEKR